MSLQTHQDLVPEIDSVQAEELNRLLGEVATLLEGETNAQVFYPTLVEKVLQATGGRAAAVWVRDGQGQLKLIHDIDLPILELGKAPHGQACHTLLLEDACLHARTQWVSPHNEGEEAKLGKSNFSSWALLLAPIVVEKKAVGLLEIAFPPAQDRLVKRQLTRLASQLASLAAAFIHRTQWQHVQRQQQLWQELEGFAAHIHDNLEPEEIAYLAANEAKKLLRCDQVSVGLCWGTSCRVAAVSGAVSVAKRSPLMQALRQLFQEVCNWGEAVSFEGTKDPTLPPGVAQALDDYLAQANCLRLLAVPLRHKGSICGIILAECFEGSEPADRLADKIKSLQRHLAPALANALQHQRMPLRWLSVPLAHCRDSLLHRGYSRLWFYLGALLLLAGLLVFVQLPLRSEATGRLVPKERRIVYSHLSGKVIHLAAHHGDRVEKGQELMFVEDLETQLKADQLLVKMNSFNQKIAFLDEQLSKNISTKERGDLLSDRIKVQFELNKARIERNLLVSEYRNPRKAPIMAPVSGQVITFDAQEKLLGKNVKLGDPLLRLANVEGSWEVELLIPEREVGRIRTALGRSPGTWLEVDLLLSSDPHRIYQGKVNLESLGGETMIQENKVVLPATVEINDQALANLLDHMPVGVEVHARVRCGQAAAGYVWFSELWDFLYERLLF